MNLFSNNLTIKLCLTAISLFLMISGCQHSITKKTKSLSKPLAIQGSVVKYGRFKSVHSGHVLNHQQSGSGKLIKGATLKLTEQTQQIPIEADGYFGFQYRISNIPKKIRYLELRRVLIHPEMKLPGGKVITGSDYVIRVAVKSGNIFDLIGYSFSEEYEQVTGEWIFQLWYKDQRLVEQKFNIFQPEP